MPHIHTDAGQHDLTASAYIVRLDKPEPRLVLHQHKLLHIYLQFGGHVELHETPWQTVIHELAEESGYDIDQLALLQPAMRLKVIHEAVLHPVPASILTHRFGDTDHYHTDIAFAFVTKEAPKHAVGKGESNKIQAFTAAELTALPKGSLPENVRDIGLFILDEGLNHWETVDTSAFAS